MWFRALMIWGLMALLEIGMGIWRVKFFNRRFGAQRARQLGVIAGSMVNFLVTLLTLPWLDARTEGELWSVGLLWLGLTLLLDCAVGRWLFHFRWKRILRDFDPRQGGWLGVGMLILLCSPWMAAVLRGGF